MRTELEIGGVTVVPGSRTTINLPVPNLSTAAPMTIPVQVIHSRHAGPRLFVCAALHGDEINGVEIIRRLMRLSILRRLHGTLIAVPIVNVFGFVAQERYLPDRRDLNRSFPGSSKGSLASRVANLFVQEIVAQATHGIDLHTGAIHRTNYPQIRADLDDPETHRLAVSCGVPLLINAGLRQGSLRETAGRYGVPVMVYEAGEALRFDEDCIRMGVTGVVNLMRALNMLPHVRGPVKGPKPLWIRSSSWERAPISGVFRATTEVGAVVTRGKQLAVISDPFGDNEVTVKARSDGVIVGRAMLPVVNEGDALFHLGHTTGTKAAAYMLDAYDRNEDYHDEATSEMKEEPPIV
ncbi:MAG: succinylglutamate desuccinylase/aspartoacylase family protein [Rhodospirillales bacterium]|nr:succinylglutamate desuccinylase/aspartoacylase family protein [Rhodospirillales bacterium]